MTKPKNKQTNDPNDRPHVLEVKAEPGESKSDSIARCILSPTAQAGITILRYNKHKDFTLSALIDRLDGQVQSATADTTQRDSQDMLAAQAHTLDSLFNALMRHAALNSKEGYLSAFETYFKLGLRAQAQCRANLDSINHIQHPRTATFVKQTNIAAGHQQVNNASRAPENEKAPNELLEDKHHERMEFGTKAAPDGADKDMETVGAVNGAKDKGRKAKVQP